MGNAADESTLLDVASSTVTYVGKATPGSAKNSPVWKLQRITSDAAGNMQIEYPNGSAFYNYSWDDRTSYDYST